ncbi:hypothetical protein QVD99_005572 [Batrachochytrium dendrobatidis]|nr:hypothetical protein O5D80_002313 [Batrachochytrium dendrobatidis]KAK5668563.1 hypothetical protein QVD99_005572 [Batrachochytrium dendrobatidis]
MQQPLQGHTQLQMQAQSHYVSIQQKRNSYSMLDFFDRFVRAADGTKNTSLPTPISRQFIRSKAVALLKTARIPPSEVTIFEDNYGGTISISQGAISAIHNFVKFRHYSRCATNIQRVWRGYTTRRQLTSNSHYQSGLKSVPANNQYYQQQQYQHHQKKPPSTSSLSTKSSISVATHSSLPTINEHAVSESVSTATSAQVSGQENFKMLQLVEKISTSYHEIANASKVQKPEPTQQEIVFMSLLNSNETFEVSDRILSELSIEDKRAFPMPANQNAQNTLFMYREYSPKVVEWVCNVLDMSIDFSTDLISILRSGDIFCRLACALYPRVECQLLAMGPRFAIHKIIFFLELCKSLHIKRALLFTVSNLLVFPEQDREKKAALIVLRTILALEKHARNSGWDGPVLSLKNLGSDEQTSSSYEGFDNSYEMPFSAAQDTNHHINMQPLVESDSLKNRDTSSPDKDYPPLAPFQEDLQNNNNALIPSIAQPLSSGEISTQRASPVLTDRSSQWGSSRHVNSYVQPYTSPKLGENLRRFSNVSANQYSNSSYPTSDSEADASASLPRSIGGDSPTDRLVPVSQSSALPVSGSYSTNHLISTPPPTRNLPSPGPSRSSEDPATSTFMREVNASSRSSPSELKQKVLALGQSFSTSNGSNFEDSRSILNDSLDAKLASRNRAISIFIEDEIKFSTNLSHIVQYLDYLVKKRCRRSNRLSKAIEDKVFKEKESISKAETSLYPENQKRSAGESNIAYIVRLESEIEGLTILQSMARNILTIHSDFITEINSAVQLDGAPGSSKTTKIGDIFLKFSEKIRRPYACFSVVALGPNKTRPDIGEYSDVEHNAFIQIVVQNFIFLSSDALTKGDTWKWFISRPLLRVATYASFLNCICDSECSIQAIDIDNRKVKLAGIRLNCLAKIISGGLSI